MLAGPSETKAQFTCKWKATVSHGIWTIFATASHGILQTGSRNVAKFSAENCGP